MAKSKSTTGRGVQGKPGRRYELTDEAWQRIEPLLPKQTRGGRWNDHRVTLNGIFWILNSGAQWRDMPERYGKWQSVYDRYRRWTREGLFDRILHRLHLELDDDGRIDWSVFDVDGSNIRADRRTAGCPRARGSPVSCFRKCNVGQKPAAALTSATATARFLCAKHVKVAVEGQTGSGAL